MLRECVYGGSVVCEEEESTHSCNKDRQLVINKQKYSLQMMPCILYEYTSIQVKIVDHNNMDEFK